jgi:hypothetical protein
MANHHMTDKGPIPFTAEEEIKWAEKEVIADKKRKEEMEEYERVKYQRDRKAEYDQMGNQFEMIFDDEKLWRKKINEIKSRYPKG